MKKSLINKFVTRKSLCNMDVTVDKNPLQKNKNHKLRFCLVKKNHFKLRIRNN